MVYLSKQHGFRFWELEQAHYEYSPFVKMIVSTGIRPDDFSFRFSTKEFEPNTSLVLYQFRAYNPIIGRFLSRDPIEEEGEENLYAMAYNYPVGKWDRLGKQILAADAPRSLATGDISEGALIGVCEIYRGWPQWYVDEPADSDVREKNML